MTLAYRIPKSYSVLCGSGEQVNGAIGKILASRMSVLIRGVFTTRCQAVRLHVVVPIDLGCPGSRLPPSAVQLVVPLHVHVGILLPRERRRERQRHTQSHHIPRSAVG